MKKSIFSFLVLSLCAATLQSAAQRTGAMAAYDTIQNARERANALWDKKDPTKKELSESLAMLYSALQYMNSTPIYELAHGNIYLNGRRHDVTMDIANVHAIAGNNDSALYYLEKMFSAGSYSSLARIEKDSAYIKLWSNPRFKAVVSKLKKQGELWGNTAFETPYKPNLTDEEKAAGLSLLWSQAKFNFVHFDHLDLDWNKTYIDYLAKVKATNSTTDYYKVLQTFYALLKDGHSNVYPPKELRKDFYSRPPMRTELIEGRVFVKTVFSDSLKKEGVAPGTEILKIDGEPVRAYAEKNVVPYQSSSTPQDMEVRAYSYGLLSGPEQKPIVMELKDPKGKVFTKSVARSGYTDIKNTFTSIEYQEIGNIGYLALNSFEDYKVNKIFDSLFTAIAKTKGLIIDIRNNGGGSSNIGYHVIQKLTDKPFKASLCKRVKFTSSPGEEAGWDELELDEVTPDGKLYYPNPVIVLIGPRSFSAAEDFAVAFDYMKRGKLVGMATGGSTGQPVGFNLPGGGMARVCGKKDSYPDGREFVGVGIQPDIVVVPTIKDLQSGTDAAKNKALELLNK